MEAISLAYEVHGVLSPLALRAHSTRSVASSQALLAGASLQDVLLYVEQWSSPHTFVRFYILDLSHLPSTRVLLS